MVYLDKVKTNNADFFIQPEKITMFGRYRGFLTFTCRFGQSDNPSNLSRKFSLKLSIFTKDVFLKRVLSKIQNDSFSENMLNKSLGSALIICAENWKQF